MADTEAGSEAPEPSFEDDVVSDSEDFAVDELPDLGSDYEAESNTEDAPEAEAEEDEATDETRYTVKVDGEELEVTLDELRNGYMRQGDYTRKTQELSAYRTLQQALEADPAGTIEALSQAYGVSFAKQVADEADDLADLDPYERRLVEMERRLESEAQARQEAQQRAEIEREAREAISAFDLKTSPEDLIQFALDKKIGDLGFAAEVYAERQQAEAKQTKLDERTQAKRAASVVERASNRSQKTVSDLPEKPTLRQAAEAAYRELMNT